MSRRACVAAAVLCAAAARADAQQTTPRARSTYEDLQLFSGVLNQLRVNHADSLDTHALVIGAIRGLLAAADPHSYLIEAGPALTGREKALAEGKLASVNIEFRFIGGAPVVTAVGGAALKARADVLPGDELIAIDGTPVRAASEEELELELAGPKGASVRLGLRRLRADGNGVDLERTVTRERRGGERAVPAAFMLDATTGYLRLATFAVDGAHDDARRRLGELERAGMQRLILDLRDNGGGRVKDAADFAALFLPDGAIVYTAAGRKAEVTDTVRVKRGFLGSAKRHAIVVLQNAGTASAAELVAGALQDHDRARIVGQPSFGKALLMYPFLLPDGSALMMTAGRVSTPCGRVVQREYRGITTREYYRRAAAERDTVGRPACRTAGGRTVYGGGGIYPDVRLARADAPPIWRQRATEALLGVRWVGSWVEAHPAPSRPPEAESSAPLPTEALADFRAFATREGVPLPEGAAVDAALTDWLQPLVALARGGEPAWWQTAIRRDPEVKAALAAFDS